VSRHPRSKEERLNYNITTKDREHHRWSSLSSRHMIGLLAFRPVIDQDRFRSKRRALSPAGYDVLAQSWGNSYFVCVAQ
jgi:hypothetical protein